MLVAVLGRQGGHPARVSVGLASIGRGTVIVTTQHDMLAMLGILSPAVGALGIVIIVTKAARERTAEIGLLAGMLPAPGLWCHLAFRHP